MRKDINSLIEENEMLKDALNSALRACYDLDANNKRDENADYLRAYEMLDELESGDD